ncbi:MAG TPA: hemerythrin domain-containing protein [Acidimicrobiales bacterium]|nr:hemerythrin domain-containing protein [Acidimicrobiales bacterium]
MTSTVVEVLDEQHQRVAELFDRVSSPEEDRPAVLHTLLQELAAHVAAERSAVAPIVKRDQFDDDLAAALKDDHDRMENLMVLIERRKFNSPDIPDLVSQLKQVSEEHAARSEKDLFPGLSALLSPEEQRELGEKVDGEEAMITSHPHPHLLSLGPVADVMTKVVSRWDRMRDRTVNNRHPDGGGDPSMGGAT